MISIGAKKNVDLYSFWAIAKSIIQAKSQAKLQDQGSQHEYHTADMLEPRIWDLKMKVG